MASIPTAKSSPPTAGPALKPMAHHEGKPSIRLSRPVYVIGSRSSCRIHLVSSSVSKAHALLVRSNGRTYIRDLASRSKVYINGEEVREAVLNDGDLVKIGTFTFQYIAGPGEDRRRPPRYAAPAKFEVSGAELPVPIEERVLVLGRRSRCDIHLLEDSVSTSHAVIFEMDGQRYIRDLGSRTGTYVNGVSTHQHMLSPHDTIRVGDNELRYVVSDAGVAAVVEEEEGAGIAVAEPEEFPGAVTSLEVPLDLLTADETNSAAAEEPLAIEPQPVSAQEVIPVEEPLGIEPDLAPAEEPIPVEEPVEVAQAPAEPEAAAELEPLPLEMDVESSNAAAKEATRVEESPAIQDEPLAAEPVSEALPADEPLPIEPLAETPIEPASLEPAFEAEAAGIPIDEPASEAVARASDQAFDELVAESVQPPVEPAVEAAPPVELEPIAETEAESLLEPLSPVAEAAVELDLALSSDSDSEPIADETPQPAAQNLQLDAQLSAPIEPLATSDEHTDLPLEPVAKVSDDTPELESIQPALELPQVHEPQRQAAPEPVLDLAEPQPAELASTPALEPSHELPLAADLHDDSHEPLATIEAAAHEDLALPESPAEPSAEHESIEPAPEELSLQAPALQGHDPQVEIPVEEDSNLELAPPPTQELSAEPVLPPEISEVIDKTEPTPQSALQSAADQLALDALAAPDAPIIPPADELTDTQFDRAVREFTGNELGELVEPPPAQAIESADQAQAPEPAEEQSTTVSDLAGRVPPAPQIPIDLPEPEPQSNSVSVSDLVAEAPAGPPPQTTPEAFTDDESDQDLELPGIELIGGDAPPAPSEPAAGQEQPVSEIQLPEPADSASVAEALAPPPAPTKPAAPRPRLPWGANQDNFLGGTPLPLRQPTAPLAPAAPANERAVQDLISEIDQIAAKAKAASATPPPAAPVAEPPTFAPVLPPRPRRNAPRPPRRKQNSLIQTEEAPAAPRDLVNTGFDGLAHSPLRDMDVFSHPGPHAEDELHEPVEHEPVGPAARHGENGGLELATEPAVDTAAPSGARRQRVTPAISDDGEGLATGQRRPQVAYAAEVTEAESSSIRRRYHRRVYMLLLVMVALMGASFWVINTYLAARVTVEGTLHYRNLQALTRFQQTEQQRILLEILGKDSTRQTARKRIGDRPQIDPGFLASPEQFDRVIQQAGFSEARPDLLVVRVVGHDADGDVARVGALLQAQYEFNKFLVDEARRAQRALEDLTTAIERDNAALNTLNNEIEVLRVIDHSRPTPQQINQLQEEVAQLETQADDAYRRVRQAEAEIERLKASPTGMPEPGNDPAIPANDQKLNDLQASLVAVQKKVSDSRTAAADQAGQARKELDAALDAFQQQVASAQGMFNGNPALTAYVQDAQRLQETTRQLTDDLIRRQESQVARLIELKERQNDRMEQRRIEVWQGDQQLRELTERLAIAERQLNTALGTGLQREADDKRSEVELIKSMIKARQELLPGDQFFAEMIRELQEVIDSTRKDIQEDRRRTEEVLAARQQAFVSSQALRNLPEEQKQVASELQAKLQQVTDARKQYNAAVDEGTTDGDSQIKSQVTTLQAAIDARKAELAEANLKGLQAQQEQQRQAALAPKQEELARLKEAEAQASAAFVEKSRQLREARARVTASAGNADRLVTLVNEKDRLERQRNANVAQLENKKREAGTAVEPVAPSDRDITTRAGNDQRLLYMGISGAGILLVFGILIVLTLHAASREAPAVTLQAADLSPQPNEKADKSSDDGEDHEPAVV